MIRICKKPECLKEIEGDFIFFEGFNNDKIYAYAAVSMIPPNAVFHLEVLNWSHNVFKYLISDWAVLKMTMKSNGISNIVITKKGTYAENKSYLKFLEKFGFPKPHQILAANYALD